MNNKLRGGIQHTLEVYAVLTTGAYEPKCIRAWLITTRFEGYNRG